MKNYNPNIYRGIHTINITIQQWDYVGHIIQKICGNCRGRYILDFDFEYDIAEDSENDCQLKYDDAQTCYSAVLRNENGDILKIEGSPADFNKMIVKMEILDYSQEKCKGEKNNGKQNYE